MKKERLNQFFGELPFVAVALVALYQLGYAAINGQWLLAVATVVFFAVVTYMDDKSANVSMISVAVGAMLTNMEATIQTDVWHVVLLIGLGLLAGYHLQLVSTWRQKQVKDTQNKWGKLKYKLVIAAYVISVCAGMYAVAFMSLSWINVALLLFFAQNIYESFCTYTPKAIEWRILLRDEKKEAAA